MVEITRAQLTVFQRPADRNWSPTFPSPLAPTNGSSCADRRREVVHCHCFLHHRSSWPATVAHEKPGCAQSANRVRNFPARFSLIMVTALQRSMNEPLSRQSANGADPRCASCLEQWNLDGGSAHFFQIGPKPATLIRHATGHALHRGETRSLRRR